MAVGEPCDAYLLHRHKLRETSLLLHVLTQEQGLLTLISKGVNGGKAPKAALMQPFVPLSVAWIGRGESAILTLAESLGPSLRLSGSALYCGFYLNELLLALLAAADPHPAVFRLYQDSLRRLERGGGLDKTLRAFELALLEELGYGLLLDHDADTGEAVIPEAYYRYRIEHGPVRSPSPAGGIRGSTLLGLRDGSLATTEDIISAKRLMRQIIDHHLGGRPLKSRAMFKQMRTYEAK